MDCKLSIITVCYQNVAGLQKTLDSVLCWKTHLVLPPSASF